MGKERRETSSHKSKRRKRRDSESSSSSSSTSFSSIDEETKRKLKKKIKKLKKKEKKKKREKRALKKLAKEKLKKEIQDNSKKKVPDELGEGSGSYDINISLMEKSKSLAPMTKEEWEKQQSILKRVFDEETGRTRLVRGTGEIMEECVSRERHLAINKQATRGDGEYFQKVLSQKIK